MHEGGVSLVNTEIGGTLDEWGALDLLDVLNLLLRHLGFWRSLHGHENLLRLLPLMNLVTL